MIRFRAPRSSLYSLLAGLLLLCAVPAFSAAETLKVGYLPITGHGKFFVAKEQGFFAQEGLEVELIEFQNSADGLNAIVAGKLDTGAFGTMAPIAHASKGSKLKIIGGLMGEDASLIAKPENAAAFAQLQNLKGKKIATVRMASGDAVLRGSLRDAGLNWKNDVQIFELKNPPAVIEAVKSGQVDAGVVWGPHDLRAEDQGLKVVARSQTLQPGHPCCRLVIMESRAKEDAVWVKFLRALLKAEKFAHDNEKETLQNIVKYVKLDPQLLHKAYYTPYLDQSTDPNKKGVNHFADVMINSEFITKKPDISTLVDIQLYERALNQLAAQEPSESYWKKLQQEFKRKNAG
jgi:NitT/TauT family transport system substrate-binding protein